MTNPTNTALEGMIRYAPGAGLIYLDNLSNFSYLTGHLKLLCLRSGTEVVENLDGLAPHIEEFLASNFFTVVRNPFVRVMMAYERLEKGLAGREAVPSFGQFLQTLSSEPYPPKDRGLAPQSVNIGSFMVTPDFIAQAENVGRLPAFLEEQEVGIWCDPIEDLRETIALTIGPSEADLIRRLYIHDFRFFGYSEDPTVLAPVRPPSPPTAGRHALRAMMLLALNASAQTTHVGTSVRTKSIGKCLDMVRGQLDGLLGWRATLQATRTGTRRRSPP